ncbi:hypothetical protein F5Y03DRAFT_405936 [Xylaria venustula]|nr:hypothetical protein F5Y03DRAFT_405936 [Xylaria venustula]
MTRDNTSVYQIVVQDYKQTCQKYGPRDESGERHPSKPHEAVRSSIAPLARSLRNNAHIDPDDLITAISLERLRYAEALHFLGFDHAASAEILRCWIRLKLDAPAGGPYDLLGIALAAIAELGEPDTPRVSSHDDTMGGITGCWDAPPRSDWPLVFAQIFNHDTLAAIQRVGVYFAPDFTKAKWLVYHMVQRKWERLLGFSKWHRRP